MAGSKPCIYVLAGTNGAGKSSVIGEYLIARGSDFVNPDLVTRQLLAGDQNLSEGEANSLAWKANRGALERAVRSRSTYSFETTLGGHSITELLAKALTSGMEVRMWFVGLATPELHIERVRARVAVGGHDIPEEKIRQRYDSSRENLLWLLPRLTGLYLYDNSEIPPPGAKPSPALLLATANGEVEFEPDPKSVPSWAKPIVELALQLAH